MRYLNQEEREEETKNKNKSKQLEIENKRLRTCQSFATQAAVLCCSCKTVEGKAGRSRGHDNRNSKHFRHFIPIYATTIFKLSTETGRLSSLIN